MIFKSRNSSIFFFSSPKDCVRKTLSILVDRDVKSPALRAYLQPSYQVEAGD
jgi:hypothetical protein